MDAIRVCRFGDRSSGTAHELRHEQNKLHLRDRKARETSILETLKKMLQKRCDFFILRDDTHHSIKVLPTLLVSEIFEYAIPRYITERY